MKTNRLAPIHGGSAGNLLLFLAVLVGLGYYLLYVDTRIIKSIITTQEEQEAAAAAPATPPVVDQGPGAEPVRSGTDRAIPVVQSAIRQKHGMDADILYKDWTATTRESYNGREHWCVGVTAMVFEGSGVRKNRKMKNYKAYFRDRKLVAVEGG